MPKNKIQITNIVIIRVITIAKSPLNNNFQLVAAESPINPNNNVIIQNNSTIYNGCTCNVLRVKLSTTGDVVTIKNNSIHNNEKMNE